MTGPFTLTRQRAAAAKIDLQMDTSLDISPGFRSSLDPGEQDP
jgi:hypothetical protein